MYSFFIKGLFNFCGNLHSKYSEINEVVAVNHFPLYSHHRLNDKDLVVYLSLFPKHSMNILHRANHTFISSHHFGDGLSIRISWKRTPTSFIPSLVSYDTIYSLHEQGEIDLISGKIMTYSNGPALPTPEAEKRFKDQFLYKLLLSSQDYHELEFDLKEETNLPEEVFHALSVSSSNYLSFYRYLEKMNKK